MLRRIIVPFRALMQHPLAHGQRMRVVGRFIAWQLRSRIQRTPIVLPFVSGARLAVARGMTGATGNIYFGLHEFEEMAFVLHFLREEDLFADVGANVGTYVVLASAVAKAKTVAFEPVERAYVALRRNIALNRLEDRCQTLQAACGAASSNVMFTQTLDTVNHVATSDDAALATASVPLVTLDETCANRVPTLAKIDVEGYEHHVLMGAKQCLSDAGLKAIIMELNGSGKRFGFEDREVASLVIGAGFRPFHYDPARRTLIPLDLTQTQRRANAVFVRDVDFVNARLKSAQAFEVNGKTF